MKQLTSTVLLLLLCFGWTPAVPRQQGRFTVAGLTDNEVEIFFISFRGGIAAADKKKVASLISYPVKVTLSSGSRRTIGNKVEFIKAYDRIFDDEFRRLIIKTDVSDLWAKSSGVATPRGEIWFSGIENTTGTYRIRIIAINGPMRS